MALLEVQDLKAGYGEMEILHDVSIQVDHGEIVSLIGPNGAGKSTLMKAIFGLVTPTGGTICFAGEDITGLKPHRIVPKGLSYVPQVENVFPSLTVEENLEMGAFLRKDNFQHRLQEIYELFPVLARKRAQKVRELSGGERQMVAMGRALMLDPKLLLLDEPSAGLSPILVKMVFDQIKLINERGVSLLIVEQNAKEALKLSHRGYVLASGQKRFEGTGEEILANEEVGQLYLGGKK